MNLHPENRKYSPQNIRKKIPDEKSNHKTEYNYAFFSI